MDTKEKIERLNDHDFQMYLGVKRKTFYAAFEVLEKQYAEEHKRGGKPVTIDLSANPRTAYDKIYSISFADTTMLRV